MHQQDHSQKPFESFWPGWDRKASNLEPQPWTRQTGLAEHRGQRLRIKVTGAYFPGGCRFVNKHHGIAALVLNMSRAFFAQYVRQFRTIKCGLPDEVCA